VDPIFNEAAGILGASWIRRVFTIDLPMFKKEIIVAWLLTFIFSIGNLDLSVLVYPPGNETLAVRIFTLMHFAPDRVIAGTCLLLISLILFMAFFIFVLINPRREPL
jgi:iron(III) transport system permease protein